MFRYPSENAPSDTWTAIGAYETRRSSTIGQMLLTSVITSLIVGVAAYTDSKHRTLDLFVLCGAIAAFALLNWLLYWHFPTRRYRKCVAAGYILEIDSEPLATFREEAGKAIEDSTEALAKAKQNALADAIRRLWAERADQAAIDAELIRIKEGLPA